MRHLRLRDAKVLMGFHKKFDGSYRRIFYGNPLEPWHPLISNDASSAIKSGETIANQAISELDINEEDLEDYIKADLF